MQLAVQMAPSIRASAPGGPSQSSTPSPVQPFRLAAVVGMPMTGAKSAQAVSASRGVDVEMPLVMERDDAIDRVVPAAELAGYYANDEGTLTAKLTDVGDDTLEASGTTCGFTPCCSFCSCPYGDEFYTRVDRSTNVFVASRGYGAIGKLEFKTDPFKGSVTGFDWRAMTSSFMHRRR